MPVPPKPIEKRQRRNTPSVGLALVSDGRAMTPAQVPSAPAGLLTKTKGWWIAYWQSGLAELVLAETDAPALERLATLYDERERCYRSARKGRLVVGYMGKLDLNPLYKHMQTLDAEIRQLEDRFGLTPMSRLRLGIQIGEAAKSLDEFNRRAAYDIDADDDPRETIEPKRVERKPT